jgi:predicted RNA-binding protein with RPS1 domain
LQTLSVGQIYDVQVVKILQFGLIVKVPELGGTEMVHISKIANTRVDNIADFVEVGDGLRAECVRGRDKIELSLKHLNLKPRAGESSVSSPKPRFEKTKSLDDMIASSSKVLKEKMDSQKKRTGDYRNKRRGC